MNMEKILLITGIVLDFICLGLVLTIIVNKIKNKKEKK